MLLAPRVVRAPPALPTSRLLEILRLAPSLAKTALLLLPLALVLRARHQLRHLGIVPRRLSRLPVAGVVEMEFGASPLAWELKLASGVDQKDVTGVENLYAGRMLDCELH
jgi:hypothetical protein